jgi:hypothetical protein
VDIYVETMNKVISRRSETRKEERRDVSTLLNVELYHYGLLPLPTGERTSNTMTTCNSTTTQEVVVYR